MRVGVVGVTGAVGREMVQVLHGSKLQVSELVLMASQRSAGSDIATPFGTHKVALFSVELARTCDVVFLAVSGDFAKAHARAIAAGDDGAVVIDNSSAFRYDPDVPLVVPEINLGACEGHRLVANPNCTTAIAAMALWPLHQRFTLKTVIVSSYQAASGAGAEGMDELVAQAKHHLAHDRPSDAARAVFAHPLAFNVLPMIDSLQDNGYTREEMKVVWETNKIFGTGGGLAVSCTAVRVPSLRAHAESITLQTERPVTVEEAREVLRGAPGVELVDDPLNHRYPMPLSASGKRDVEVGRVRQSLVFGDHGLDLFVCGDQLLRGAALNAVLIAEGMFAGDARPRKARKTAAQ